MSHCELNFYILTKGQYNSPCPCRLIRQLVHLSNTTEWLLFNLLREIPGVRARLKQSSNSDMYSPDGFITWRLLGRLPLRSAQFVSQLCPSEDLPTLLL